MRPQVTTQYEGIWMEKHAAARCFGCKGLLPPDRPVWIAVGEDRPCCSQSCCAETMIRGRNLR